MSQVNLFKSRPQTVGFVFKSGKTIHFVNHQYTTTFKNEIDELTTECESNPEYFYIEDGRAVVDSTAIDPLSRLKAEMYEQAKKDILAAQGNPLRDMGSTEFSGKLEGIANSQTIRGLTADSESQAVQAHKIVPAQPTVKKL